MKEKTTSYFQLYYLGEFCSSPILGIPKGFTPDAGYHDLRADIIMQLCSRFYRTHINSQAHVAKQNVCSC